MPVNFPKIPQSIKDILIRLSPVREPVLFFAAVQGYVYAWLPSLVDSDLKKAFVLAAVAWGQRSLSTPKANAEAQAEGAAYVGALEHQATAQAGQLLAAPQRPIRVRPAEQAGGLQENV